MHNGAAMAAAALFDNHTHKQTRNKQMPSLDISKSSADTSTAKK